MTTPVPAWLPPLLSAADRAYELNPPKGPLAPETAARIRRTLPPPPGEAKAA